MPGIGPAAAKFSQSVYDDGTLGLREFEAARLRIAQINGCLGSWLALGRLNRVLGLDEACVLPSHYQQREKADA